MLKTSPRPGSCVQEPAVMIALKENKRLCLSALILEKPEGEVHWASLWV